MQPSDLILEEAVGALDAGLVAVDRAGKVLLWNPWVEAASGITKDKVLGTPLEDTFTAAAAGRLSLAISEALDSGASSLLTHTLHGRLFPLRTRTGGDLIHNVSIRPLGQKPYEACLIQIVDVSAAWHRERVLRDRQNARYDAVVGSAPDAILTLDRDGTIQLANPAALRKFGRTAEELLGTPAVDLFVAKDAWEAAWSEVLASGRLEQPVELQTVRSDKALSYMEISAAQWTSDRRVFVTAILRDMTSRRATEEELRRLNETLEERVTNAVAERNRMEEALRQSQKMEAIGQLTGGIAHDFNNLLTGIIGSMDMMKRRLESRRYHDLPRFMDAAAASANRAAALTHRLLAFARRQPLSPRPVDPNQLIDSMKDLLSRTLGERIRLNMDLAPDLWPTQSDPSQLENGVLNLAINARDAMPDGGTLTIATQNTTLATAETSRHGDEVEAGDYVIVRVSDTGIGIAPDLVEKVFEPFFTTKPLGEGTGLGLSMVYGFAKQSKGHVIVESQVGKGTDVCLYLPRHYGSVQALDLNGARRVPRGEGEAVLLVEDDPEVRLLIGEVLRDLGYACIEAGDGNAAMPILASNTRIDLLITDVGLPGIDGRRLAEIAREHRPHLNILFVTGYAEHATSSEGFLQPGMGMVTKPFAVDALALRIRDMISSPHEPDESA